MPLTAPTAFDTPAAQLITQILGAVSQFEKAMLVAKLKGARDRKRAKGGKVEGRKAYSERKEGWESLREAVLALNDGRSLREISQALEDRGFVTAKGKPVSASSVKSMIEQAGATLHSHALSTPEDIIAHCRQHVAHYKAPRFVVFTGLPKTSTGKVQKYILREMAKAV